MKRLILLLTIGLTAFASSAQNYDKIKNLLVISKYEEAKTELEKNWTNAKFIAKPEAYLLKATILSGMATNLLSINIGMTKDEVLKKLGQPKNTSKTTTDAGSNELLIYEKYSININPNGKVDWIREAGNTTGEKGTNEMQVKMESLMAEADESYSKYKSMEPDLGLTSDLVYQNSHVNLYSYYYTSGYQEYTENNWAPAQAKLKKAVIYSDILMSRKLLNSVLDTNVLILAGITAEKSNDMDAAMTFYKRLADAKVTGDGFEGVYRFLVSHSFGNHDMAGFEKYKALGKSLFPKSDYFNYDKIDFAVGLTDNFNEKLNALNEVLSTDPNNQKANQVLGEIIYDTLNPKEEGAIAPANFDELEKKMIEAFNKSAKAKPCYEIPYLYIGDHFINKASKVGERRDAHAKDMRARTKPGTMASKDDVNKRDALDREYSETLDGAREPYEKAAAILAENTELEARDKQQYKKVASYLSDIYANKKVNAKNKPAEQAKYAAEEKKWNDLYENIGKIKEVPHRIRPCESKSDSELVNNNSSSNSSQNNTSTNNNSNNNGVIYMKKGASGTYKIPCYLNGIPMEFTFDTGASDVSISLTEAKFLLKNGHLKIEDIKNKQNYTIANGDVEVGYQINIRELKIGNYTLTNVRGSIASSDSAPLLLGMSAIEKLGLKFDPSKGALVK